MASTNTIGMVLLMMIMVSLTSLASALSVNYYEHTCPQVESIVAGAVHKATMNDKTVPSALLRMHFHDCFVRVMIYIYIYMNHMISIYSILYRLITFIN